MSIKLYPAYTYEGIMYYDKYNVQIQFVSSVLITLLKNGLLSSVSMIGILKYTGETGISAQIIGQFGAPLGGPLGYNGQGILKYTGEVGIQVELTGRL